MRSYQLMLEVTRAITVQIGKLGRCLFEQGSYVYTGSARRHLASRIERHMRKKKRLRWHIDYLLAHPAVEIRLVRISNRKECALNQTTPGRIAVKGFGSSDCKAGCGSHLKYTGDEQLLPGMPCPAANRIGK